VNLSSPAWLLQNLIITRDRPTEIEIKTKDYEANSNREHAEDVRAMFGKYHEARGQVLKALLKCHKSAALKKHHCAGKEK
jgi:hypothetical protein